MSEANRDYLKRIVIKGFKSINNCDLELKNINVFIGSNGAGKSNLVSVFELLQNIEQKEAVTVWTGSPEHPSKLLLEKYQCNVYQFHDTGSTSKIKMEHNLSNSKFLRQDASNLAAFLYRLREHYPASYQKILKAIQRIAPYFKDFKLEPDEYNNEHIVLRWRQKGCEDIFNASQISDGTLRFICLAALLLQPADLQPNTIIIDEPELGLHPYAITIFAELVKKAAIKKQIILATQSTEQLRVWLEDDYTLGELWNKNIFGGRVSG